jgi:hypothetical protein
MTAVLGASFHRTSARDALDMIRYAEMILSMLPVGTHRSRAIQRTLGWIGSLP